MMGLIYIEKSEAINLIMDIYNEIIKFKDDLKIVQ